MRPLSLAVRGGQLLVCDIERRALVQVDPRTGVLRPVTLRGIADPVDPVAVAADERGNAYVADAAGKRILQVGPSDEVVRSYTLPADAPFTPIDVAVSADRVYAVNRAARRVEMFDLESGVPVGPFSGSGEAPLQFPIAVGLGPDGRLYIVDMMVGQVRVYEADGRPVRDLGGPGDRPGRFAQPRSVAIGPGGLVYVSDTVTQVVQVFDAEGALLMYFGGADGSIGAMGMPAKVITDRTLLEEFRPRMPVDFTPQYMIFVANQAGPGRIGVYAFGQVAAREEAK